MRYAKHRRPRDQRDLVGDGLYASYDGFSLWLRAPREHGDHYVALEPSVFQSFLEFAQACGSWRKS